MRISLSEPKAKSQARPKRRFRRRRSHTFNSSMVQSLPRARRRSPKRSDPSRLSRAQVQLHADQAVAADPLANSKRLLRGVLLRRWWSWLILGALLGAIVFASADARFFVYEAQIVGAGYLSTEAIYQASGVHEQNIFWVQPHEVEERIGQLSGISAVHVHCGLPAQVVIEVDERKPLVLWRSTTLIRDWWVDDEGIVLPYHGDPKSEKTIFVVDSSGQPIQPGDRLQPEGIVQSLMQLAAALPGTRVFYYESDHGLSFTQQLGAGEWPVYVGSSDDLPHKIQVVDVLSKYFGVNRIRPSYVDVRWADRPLYGLPGGKNGGGND